MPKPLPHHPRYVPIVDEPRRFDLSRWPLRAIGGVLVAALMLVILVLTTVGYIRLAGSEETIGATVTSPRCTRVLDVRLDPPVERVVSLTDWPGCPVAGDRLTVRYVAGNPEPAIEAGTPVPWDRVLCPAMALPLVLLGSLARIPARRRSRRA